MNNEKARTLLKEALEDMNSRDLVQLHNVYCDLCNMCDDEIHANDEDFFETFFNGSPYDLYAAVARGDCNPNHDWIRFNGYGNLQTSNCVSDWIDESDIVDYMIENDEDLENEDIRDILNDCENEDDEDDFDGEDDE